MNKKHLAFLSLFLFLQIPAWALNASKSSLGTTDTSKPVSKSSSVPSEKGPPKQPQKLPQNWQIPVQGKLTNPFGNGYWYYGIYRGGHTGIDIKAAAGAPVVSAASGKVVMIHDYQDRRYGRYIVIQHAPGFYALYGHMSGIHVKINQDLKMGQRIGDVGITGAAGYPHVHFEVMNQVPVRDGAWGYAYICSKQPVGQDLLHFNFLNLAAREMPAIRRQRVNGCSDIPLRSPLVYYNPEYFFGNYQFKPWLSEFQPENEEVARWRNPQRTVPKTRPSASAKSEP
ncbi:MAG: M23 family metallopeptidase [Candidatus Sericytochromatia bacterium]|nr:M23 family metallopeptidase [Candidatus Sericytochromatia bacterium]